ncbi:MAG: hypothetical protein K9L88_08040 [Chromatiaceae bacterium]|nr:hypothetical protein [Chromatiaceae bacterium]
MSLPQPGLIKYNLRERGRQYRGVERHYDIPAIVDSINGGATQERVKTRGMLGYFGHWPRLKFGLEPAEGGVVDGKAQAVEPAVVTTHLAAFDDGTVEHQTEFLDNATGQLAARMYANRVGGFSSAIDPNKPELFGFDWVNDPNYSTNRGYDLLCDSIAAGELTLDGIVAQEQFEQATMMNRLVATLEANLRLAMDTANGLEKDNEELMAMVEKLKQGSVSPDGLVTDSAHDLARSIEREVKAFQSEDLPRVHDPVKLKDDDRSYMRLRRRVVTGY